MAQENYTTDVDFLKNYTDLVELTAPESDESILAVAPQFCGRVMTSSLSGPDGASYGWLNKGFIQARKPDPQFNNYGGEDRFWLGPEGGQYALWFQKGQPFDTTHWKTPAGFDQGTFTVTSQGNRSVSMTTHFEVANFSAARFDCAVKRTISVLGREQAAKFLAATPGEGVKMVAFESSNTLANSGHGEWTPDKGLLSIWILGQFKPLPRGKVIVPFLAGSEARLGVKATTNYFGELPAERGKIFDDYMLYTCDGKFRSKIGISPRRAKNVLGSYDPDAQRLTIVQFNLPAGAAKLPYVNSLWEMQDKPFAGDVVNSYNDGVDDTGKQLGPFYEIETSSPAAELASGESTTHLHRTFHFAGDFDALNDLAGTILGVDLGRI
jgi:hypothetical protein